MEFPGAIRHHQGSTATPVGVLPWLMTGTARTRPLGKAPLDVWRFTVASPHETSRVPGTLAILSCPPALCPHAEFAIAAVLGMPVSLAWSSQPAAHGRLLAAMDYAGTPGTAAQLAARLRQLGPVAFEVSAGPGPGTEQERFSYSPALGMFRAAISAAGEILVGEGQLRDLIGRAGSSPELALGVDRLLGTAWDEELEPLRQGGDGAPVTWLRRTG